MFARKQNYDLALHLVGERTRPAGTRGKTIGASAARTKRQTSVRFATEFNKPSAKITGKTRKKIVRYRWAMQIPVLWVYSAYYYAHQVCPCEFLLVVSPPRSFALLSVNCVLPSKLISTSLPLWIAPSPRRDGNKHTAVACMQHACVSSVRAADTTGRGVVVAGVVVGGRFFCVYGPRLVKRKRAFSKVWNICYFRLV